MGCGASKRSQVVESHVQPSAVAASGPAEHQQGGAFPAPLESHSAGVEVARSEVETGLSAVRSVDAQDTEDDERAKDNAEALPDPALIEQLKAEVAAYEHSLEDQLFYAVLDGKTEIVQDLLSQNVSPATVHAVWGKSPLHAACEAEQLEVLRILLPACKDVDHADVQGKTSSWIVATRLLQALELNETIQRSKPARTRSHAREPDVKGRATGQRRMVRFSKDSERCCRLEDALLLLRETGSDWGKACLRKVRGHRDSLAPFGPTLRRVRLARRDEAKRNGWGWDVAGDGCAMDRVQEMVRRFGCVWEACSGRGSFALREILALYRQWGVLEGFDVDQRDATSRSLLHCAADAGSQEALELLIEEKGDLAAVDHRGQSALHYACRRAHSKAVRTLLEAQPGLATDVDHMGRSALHLWRFEGVDVDTLQLLAARSEPTHDVLGQTAGHRCAAAGSQASFATLCAHLPSFGEWTQERAARKAPPFTSLPRGGWAGDAGWPRASKTEDADPRGALRPPMLKKRRKMRRKNRGGAQAEGDGVRGGAEGEAEEVAPEAAGRTALEVALVAANREVVHSICGSEDWEFPSPDTLCGDRSPLRLALQVCRRSTAQLVPAAAMRAAWRHLRDKGGVWPTDPGDDLLRLLAAEGELDVVLQGSTLLCAVVERQDPSKLSAVLHLGVRDSLNACDGMPSPLAVAASAGSHEQIRMLLRAGTRPDARIAGPKRVLWCDWMPEAEWRKRQKQMENSEEEEEEDEDEEGDEESEEEEEDTVRVSTTSEEVSCVVDAVLRADIDTLEALLEHGADCAFGANLSDDKGEISALHALLRARPALGRVPRPTLCERWAKAAERMVELGGFVLDEGGEHESGTGSLLALSIRKGYREAAFAILARAGDRQAELATGAVVDAVNQGDVELVRALVDAKADLSVPGSRHRSVVQVAMARRQYEVALWLCQRACSMAIAGAKQADPKCADSLNAGLLSELVGELAAVSMAQHVLVGKRRLVGRGGWRPCLHCFKRVKDGLIAADDADCDHFDEQDQWGGEEEGEAEDEEEEEEEEEEAVAEEEQEGEAEAEGEEEGAMADVKELKEMGRLGMETRDRERRDLAALCSCGDVKFPLELLQDLWKARDGMHTWVVPWAGAEAGLSMLNRTKKKDGPPHQRTPHQALGFGKVYRPWQGQGRTLPVLERGLRGWWQECVLGARPALRGRLEPFGGLDRHSLILILTAVEGILLRSVDAELSHGPAEQNAAAAFAILTGSSEVAAPLAEIPLVKPGDDQTDLMKLQHRLVTESHIGVDHHILLDGTLRWISPLGLAGLCGNLEAIEAILKSGVDCSKGAQSMWGEMWCSLRLLLKGAPPIRRVLRSALHERWASVAEQLVKLGGGFEGRGCAGGKEGEEDDKDNAKTKLEPILALTIRRGYREAALAIVTGGGVEHSSTGAGALIQAVKSGDCELVAALVASGADVNDADGEETLFETARTLRSATMAACLSMHLEQWDAAMLLAACGCREGFLQSWLQMSPEDVAGSMPRQSVDGRTLLMHAIEGGSVDIVDAILKADAESVWDAADVMCAKHALARRFTAPPSVEEDSAKKLKSWERNRVNVRKEVQFSLKRRTHPVLLAADRGMEDVFLRLVDACPEPLEFEFEWQYGRNLLQLCASRGMNRAIQYLLRSGKGQNDIERGNASGEEAEADDDEHDEEEGSEASERSSRRSSRGSWQSEVPESIVHPPLLCACMNFRPECALSIRQHQQGLEFSTSDVVVADALQKMCYHLASESLLWNLRSDDWSSFSPYRISFPSRHRRRNYCYSRGSFDLSNACGDIPLSSDLLLAADRTEQSHAALRWATINKHHCALEAFIGTFCAGPTNEKYLELLSDCVEAGFDKTALVLIRGCVQSGVFASVISAHSDADQGQEDETRDEDSCSQAEIAAHLWQRLMDLPLRAIQLSCFQSATALVFELKKSMDARFSDEERFDFLVLCMTNGLHALCDDWVGAGCKIPESLSKILPEWRTYRDKKDMFWQSRTTEWQEIWWTEQDESTVASARRGRRRHVASERSSTNDRPPWHPEELEPELLSKVCFPPPASEADEDFSTTFSLSYTVAQDEWKALPARNPRFPESKGKIHQSPLLLGTLQPGANTVKDMQLWYCGINPENVSKVELALANSKTDLLDLTSNPLRSQGVSALSGHPGFASITVLSLAQNSIPALGAQVLARVLPPGLRSLDLDLNRVADKGAAHLAAALPACRRLEFLSLDSNLVGNQGFIALATAMPKCASLKYFGFAGNLSGDEGNQALSAALIQATKSGQLQAIKAGDRPAPFQPRNQVWEMADLVGPVTRACDFAFGDAPFLVSLVASITPPACLDLSGTDLRDSGAARLCDSLMSTSRSLEELVLCRVQMTRAGLQRVSGLCKVLPRLRVLRLSGNQFGPAKTQEVVNVIGSGESESQPDRKPTCEFSACVALLLQSLPSLEVLALSAVGIGAAELADMAQALEVVTSCKLRELDLGHNFRRVPVVYEEVVSFQYADPAKVERLRQKVNFELAGVEALASVLSSARFAKLEQVCLDSEVTLEPLRTLQAVDLRSSMYSVRDMTLASQFLKQNSQLTVLDLSMSSKSEVMACVSQLRATVLDEIVVKGKTSQELSKSRERFRTQLNVVPFRELMARSVTIRAKYGAVATSLICKVLGFNTSLEELNLSNNCFSELAFPSADEDLYTAIATSEHLTRVHDLSIDGIGSRSFTELRKVSFRVDEWLAEQKAFRSGLLTLFSLKFGFATSVLRRSTSLTKLHFSCDLKDVGESSILATRFSALCKAIAVGAPKLQELDLRSCRMGVQCLQELLSDNFVGTALTALKLCDNALTVDINDVLTSRTDLWSRLETLELSKNRDLVTMDPFVPFLATNTVLKVLELKAIGLKSGQSVWEIVRGQERLLELDIADNPLGDDWIQDFGAALRTCTNLQKLHVANTARSAEACATLMPALLQLSQLTQLNDVKVPARTSQWKVQRQASTWEMHELVLFAGRLSKLSDDEYQKYSLPALNPDINLKGCGLTRIPSGIVLLTNMQSLDISDNHMEKLPVPELCRISSLQRLTCTGNSRLVSPPPEIASQGAEETMQFLRLAFTSGEPNRDMLFVAIGDGESGKTSVINAITSESNVSARINEDTRTVGIDIRAWSPAGAGELKVNIMDLAGQAVYSMSHQFFLVRRGIYVLVWRAREVSRGTPNVAMKKLRTMVLHWMDSLQLKVPGATMVLVVTHIDCVGSEDELNLQTQFVQKTVREKLKLLEDASRKSNVLPLKVLRGGDSFRVNCLSGDGVQVLRSNLVQLIVDLPWYGEQIPGSFLRLRDWVSVQLSAQNPGGSSRDRRTWIDWASYSRAMAECGLDHVNAAIATSFLHELGVLKYFADAQAVLQKTSEWHPPLTYLETLEDTVFISPHWIIDSLKGLMRHDREALLNYFGGDGIKDRSRWLRRVHRLSAFGIMHEELVPYMWPSDGRSEHFWAWARTQEREGMLWERDVATDSADYERVLALLEGCDIIHRIGDDEYVAPGLLSSTQAKRVDARAYSDESCPFGKTLTFEALPPGFFERVIVRCRRLATHMDFTPSSAIFYRRGLKAQVFVVRGAEEGASNVNLVIRASSRRQLEEMSTNITRIQQFFPGMHREFEKTFPGMDELKEPVQVEFLVGSRSIASLKAAKTIQDLLVSEDVKLGLSIKGSTRIGLTVKFPTNDLLWMMETLEAKCAVIAKEAFRRSVPLVTTLLEELAQLRKLMEGCHLLSRLAPPPADGSENGLLAGIGTDVWSPLVAWVLSAQHGVAAIDSVLAEWDSIREEQSIPKLKRVLEVCRALLDTDLARMAADFAKTDGRGTGAADADGRVEVASDDMALSAVVQAEMTQAAEARLALRSVAHAGKSAFEHAASIDLKDIDAKIHLANEAMFSMLQTTGQQHENKREEVVRHILQAVDELAEAQRAAAAQKMTLEHMMREMEPVTARLSELSAQKEQTRSELSDELAVMEAARHAVVLRLEKFVPRLAKDITELKALKKPPYPTDAVLDMIAILKRAPMPPIEMTQFKDTPVLAPFGVHKHTFIHDARMAQLFSTFAVDSVTNEDVELLQPYFEQTVMLKSMENISVQFATYALDWIRSVCDFHAVGNTPRMQSAKQVETDLNGLQPVLEARQEEFDKAMAQHHQQLVSVDEASEKQLMRLMLLEDLERRERVRVTREQWGAQCPLLVAAQVLSLPWKRSLKAAEDETRDAWNAAVLQPLEDLVQSEGEDRSKWRRTLTDRNGDRMRVPMDLDEPVGADGGVPLNLLEFLFVLGRIQERTEGQQQSPLTWGDEGSLSPWATALRRVYEAVTEVTDAHAIVPKSLQPQLAPLVELLKTGAPFSALCDAAKQIEVQEEDEDWLDLTRRLASIPSGCVRLLAAASVAVAGIDKHLERLTAMERWLEGLGADSGDVEDFLPQGAQHPAWWSDVPEELSLDRQELTSDADEDTPHTGGPGQQAQAEDGPAEDQGGEGGRSVEEDERRLEALAQKAAIKEDYRTILTHPQVEPLAALLREAAQAVPPVLKDLHGLQLESGGARRLLHRSRMKEQPHFAGSIARGANPLLAREGSRCQEACHLLVAAIEHGSEQQVQAAVQLMLDLGVSPADKTLSIPVALMSETDPAAVDCFELASKLQQRTAKQSEGGRHRADLLKNRVLKHVDLLSRALHADVVYLRRLDTGAQAESVNPTRLERVIRSAPDGASNDVSEIRQTLKSLKIRSFAELVARKADGEVSAMLDKFEWLCSEVHRMEADPASGNSDVRVVVVCMDGQIAKDLEVLEAFREHSSKRRAIIPLILPGFQISNYSHWWPDNMQELSKHALFVDCRNSKAWPAKVANEFLPQVNKFLEEWRGEAVDPSAFREVLSRVPCNECVRSGVEPVHHFNREATHALLEKWRNRRLQSMQLVNGDTQMEPPAETADDVDVAVSGDAEETLTQTCASGHAVRLVDVLSKAVIYDAVPCPQCLHHGVVPPFCFNRRHCLLYFNEDNQGRIGAMECSKCLAAGRPASIRILDIIAPEVFLSYNWGVLQNGPDGTQQYSTQAIVKPVQQRLESEEDVVCWFDVGGGMGAGQNLKAEMEEGIRKCTVVIVFLADSYVNSDNCKREFSHAVRMCKYLIPVLVPDGGMTRYGSSGWTGNGAEDAQWWMHAAKMCAHNAHPDTGHPIAWSMLQHFEPVDMRGEGQALPGSSAELEVRRRIASRFHRGEHIKHKTDANYALWSRARAKVRHALARRRAGKASTLFPGTEERQPSSQEFESPPEGVAAS